MPSAALKAPLLGGRGSVTLDSDAFGAGFNMPLVHETVRAELNARRRGTASTKTRGQVRGGGAKPWRQKGTGRARAGSSRSPIWTGGGIVFGPSPRSYTVKVNRKARRGALRSALSVHAGRGSLAVFDASKFTEPSTSQAASLLSDWGADSTALVLLTLEEAAAGKSFRNLARVSVMPVHNAGVADIIGAASLLVSKAALPSLVSLALGGPGEAEAAPEAEAAAEAAPDAEATRSAAPEADAAEEDTRVASASVADSASEPSDAAAEDAPEPEDEPAADEPEKDS